MLVTCWSSKGGSGTTVVAAALATLLAAEAGSALLVDLGGDLPAALGLPDPAVGLTQWVAGDRLELIEVAAGHGLRLVPRGAGDLAAETGPPLAAALAGRGAVVVDAGLIGSGTRGGVAVDLAMAASASLLVLRPCFLALRRAVAAPLRPSGVVLVEEPERALGPADVEAALGVPVVAVVPWDPAVARRVDAGLLGTTLPRGLARALRRVRGGGPRLLPADPPPTVERPRGGFRLLAGGAGCGPSSGDRSAAPSGPSGGRSVRGGGA